MHVLELLLNPPVLGVVALFLSAIWMLRDQKDKTRPLLVFALTLNLFYGFLLTTVMGREGGLFPWKFDHVLFCVDQSLGISAAAIARALQGAWRDPLWIVYQLMVPMMIVWFLVTAYRGIRASVVLAYIAELVVGPLLYALLPACGPIYAFRQQWLHPPSVQPQAIQLAGMPNAFPSLHVGTAFLLLLYAPGKLWKTVAFAFFAATCMATISTGEHYVIDLIPGLAFGAFAAAAGSRNVRHAILFLFAALAWSLIVRFLPSALIAHPWLTRSLAASTVALAIFALGFQWKALAPREKAALAPA